MFRYPPDQRGIPHSTPFKASILVGTRSFLQLMWDPLIYLIRGLASLLAHSLVFTPFEVQLPHWHIAQCLALIPFVTV